MLCAHLRLASRADRGSISPFAQQRMTSHHDSAETGRRKVVLPIEFKAAINDGTEHHAARVRFVGVAEQLPACSKSLGDARQIGLVAHYLRETARSFDRLVGADEAPL